MENGRAADMPERMRYSLESSRSGVDCIVGAFDIMYTSTQPPTSDYVTLYYDFVTHSKTGRKAE